MDCRIVPRKYAPRAFAWALVLALAPDAAPARAELMRFAFGGAITSADPSSGVAPGTRFSGTFAYDPDSGSSGMHFEGFHQYDFGKSVDWPWSAPDSSGMTLDLGGKSVYAFQGGLGLLMTGDEPFIGYPRGTGTHVSIGNGSVGDSPIRVALDLANPDRAVYPSLAPPSSLDLADFSSATLTVNLGGPGSAGYRGSLDTITRILPSPAPEPSTAALLVAATGWLAIAGRRGGPGRPGAGDGRHPESRGS